MFKSTPNIKYNFILI